VGDITHVIVDEVHERSVDTDFLLAVLKRMLPSLPTLKVVLMSATLESSLFASYFASRSGKPCPVIDIPGRTFPVRELYLNDVAAAVPDLRIQLPKKKDMTAADPDADAVDAATLTK
jgi:ATP-dependent RNA helicase DHX57